MSNNDIILLLDIAAQHSRCLLFPLLQRVMFHLIDTPALICTLRIGNRLHVRYDMHEMYLK